MLEPQIDTGTESQDSIQADADLDSYDRQKGTPEDTEGQKKGIQNWDYPRLTTPRRSAF